MHTGYVTIHAVRMTLCVNMREQRSETMANVYTSKSEAIKPLRGIGPIGANIEMWTFWFYIIDISNSLEWMSPCTLVLNHYCHTTLLLTSIVIKIQLPTYLDCWVCFFLLFCLPVFFHIEEKLCHNILFFENVQRQCAMDRVDVPIKSMWTSENFAQVSHR